MTEAVIICFYMITASAMKELKVFHFTEIIFYDLQKTVDFTSIKSEYLRVLNFARRENNQSYNYDYIFIIECYNCLD